jgi:glycosyltransferase involved in cell wall biosynthesis
MKKKVLILTPLAFHNNVGNAGSKTVNYYTKRLLPEEALDIVIAYLGDNDDDYNKMLAEIPEVAVFVSFSKKSTIRKVLDYLKFGFIYPGLKLVSPKYYVTDDFAKDRIKNCLDKVIKSGFVPDVIIVEFPRIVYWISYIKQFFPNAKTIASCHDVTFLGVQRYLAQKAINPHLANLYYQAFKRKEIQNLNHFDHVVVLNSKDKLLLEMEPQFTNENIVNLSPYFDFYKRDLLRPKRHVVYFAAMSRMENIHAAKWFLENVWNKLVHPEESEMRFKIIGGGLPQNLKNKFLAFHNVDLEGFVKDPTELFDESFCFVVPLKMGAGIKIKVLDAMNSGIPVVTNSIGIEGIPGKDGIDYLHAETPDEFCDHIRRLRKDTSLQERLGKNSRTMIGENFNLDASYSVYRSLILN